LWHLGEDPKDTVEWIILAIVINGIYEEQPDYANALAYTQCQYQFLVVL